MQVELMKYLHPAGLVMLRINGVNHFAQPPHKACDRLKTAEPAAEDEAPLVPSFEISPANLEPWCMGLHDIRLAAHWLDKVAETAMRRQKQIHEITSADVLEEWLSHLAPTPTASGFELMTVAAARRIIGLQDAALRHLLACHDAVFPARKNDTLRMLRYPFSRLEDDPALFSFAVSHMPRTSEWFRAGQKACAVLLRVLSKGQHDPALATMIESLKTYLAVEKRNAERGKQSKTAWTMPSHKKR